ncbi:MAG: tRNA (adenosine(37)-N6)-dimethylallyltransferase MiaA [Campylobacterales bacterium]|nr:tRNA (adenosine(37)-N6)-dimethylallyltransferase MiaA [Campylobacterales bacterium]
MKQVAILGPTASGKTALALTLARRYKGVILSLDSLALYKEIDIASAKPTLEERGDVPHFGIDVITPDMPFNVTLFFDLYRKAKAFAKEKGQPLIMVGGTSFYLKAMLEGMSEKPPISTATKARVQAALEDIAAVQTLAQTLDPVFAARTEKFDRYRLEKWLELYYETGEIPTAFQARTLQAPLIDSLPLFEIEVERALLRERIKERTQGMLAQGLVTEVQSLEERYGRKPACMKAIGIKEVLGYLDGMCSYEQMEIDIATHTAQLAKRQRTFNKTQFRQPIIKKPVDALAQAISPYM